MKNVSSPSMRPEVVVQLIFFTSLGYIQVAVTYKREERRGREPKLSADDLKRNVKKSKTLLAPASTHFTGCWSQKQAFLLLTDSKVGSFRPG